MAKNTLLEEFVNQNPDNLKRRLTDLFDQMLTENEEVAVESVRAELQVIIEEQINALDQN
jgi:hypothetical protein